MKKVFLYPMKAVKSGFYTDTFIKELSKKFLIVNYQRKPLIEIFDFYKYFFQADIFYLGWIEESRFFSLVFFLVFFFLAKTLRRKIVWVHHNKHAHEGKGFLNLLTVFILKHKADFIVFHTKESYAALGLPLNSPRVLYFFHPFFSNEIKRKNSNKKHDFDLLIWGNVRKSKGVLEFLKYLKQSDRINKFKIIVIGKFESESLYGDMLKICQGSTVQLVNRFIDKVELLSLHERSKLVFFPYTGSSVMNSGALVTSLPMGTPIVAPNVGAFKELGEKGFIYNYHSYEDVLSLCEKEFKDLLYPEKEINEFIEKNSFSNFASFLSDNIK